ncbi:hypothetical protein Tco_1443392, partial [Tanacetum coccineum]
SISNGWLSFSKRGGAADPCCYSKKFDTLKNWNNHFFWIDALVYLLSTSWFSGTSVVMDPLPVDEAVDIPCMELLNENRTLIRKYPKTFLCFVGLIRLFTETDVLPTLLHDNNEEMGLLDFVKSADPFKVKVREQNLVENEVLLITKTEDKVISPSIQTISLVDHTNQDELNANSGKRRKRVAFGEQAAAGSRSAAAVTKDVTSSSVTPTLERALEDDPYDNVRTRPPSGHFVVLSSGSADTNIPATSQVVPLVSSSQAGTSVLVAESSSDGHPLSAPELETGTLSATSSQCSSADDFYESQTIDSATALNVYIPNWSVTNNARVDNSVTCQNLLDHVTPLGYWAMLRNQHDAGFLDSFNINSAQHVCMVSELRLRYKHEIMTREKYKKWFTDSVALVQQRDAEVAELKSKLEKLESEAAKVEELCKRVSDLEAAVAVKVGEAASLTAQNAGLLEKVSALELERDGLKGQVMGKKRAVELDARIADVRRDMDNDLYPHMLTAIAGRRWVVGHGIQEGLEAGVVHGRAGRSLTQIEAYDPKVEGKYVAAVFEFEGVSFPLLDELESLKDSPLMSIMSALILKDDQGNTDTTPEFARSASGGTSGSVPPYDSPVGVAHYHVSTLVLPSDGGPTDPPPVVQPHDDLFDTSILDKSGDV